MKNIFFSTLFLSNFLISETVPNWIKTGKGERMDHIYGIGSASQNINFQQQEKIAKMIARASLSENISVDIKSEFEKYTNLNGRTFGDYVVTQKSANLIKESFVENSWTNDDGELFILIAVPKSLINNHEK